MTSIYTQTMKNKKTLLAAAYRMLRKNKKFLVIGMILLSAAYFFQIYYSVVTIKKHHSNDSASAHSSRFRVMIEMENKTKTYFYESGRYLINTSTCQIPDIDPFHDDVKKFFDRKKYTNCRDVGLLSYIKKYFNTVTLNVNTSLLSRYSSFRITCCYSEIHRVEGNDDEIKFTKCKTFKKSTPIHHPFVKVICRNIFSMKVYENVHATTLLEETDKKGSTNRRHLSVLLVGIDSMSKQNLRRTMPKTYTYLEKNFINMRGYTKIEDNTYPNLMAILTGENTQQLDKSCPFYDTTNTDKSSLSKCNLVWKQFHDLGYVTALGEDASPMGTFNYDKKGFADPPTRYYYRPYFLAAEQLVSNNTNTCHRMFCSGPENSGERLLNVVKDFSVTFKNRPSFGFFWMNSFSHDNINCASSMDEKVYQFLSDLSFVDSLANTVLVFCSDHGTRYGDFRQTFSGWLEERLPFMYLRVPEIVQRRFPEEYENVLINSRRLTTPYDIYNTFQHVLGLRHGHRHWPRQSPACDGCKSLFKEIPENRTCEEAEIEGHWCTCFNYYHIPVTNAFVRRVATFIVEEINEVIQTFPEGNKCQTYSVQDVYLAGISDEHVNADKEDVVYVLAMIDTRPEAKFEATVEVPIHRPYSFKLVGSVSRVNMYGNNIFCIRDGVLKKYCYCAVKDTKS